MKTVKKYLLGAAFISIAALTGCKDKMTELNTDPKIVTSADLREQFYAATREFMSRNTDHTSARMRTMGSLLQYFAHNSVGESTRVYGATKTDIASPWPSDSWNYLYGEQKIGVLLDDIVRTYDENYTSADDQERYSEIRAISQLVLIYQYWTNMDATGAIVYTQSFKAITEGITRPEYDLYHEVYQEMIEKVKTEVIDVLKQPAGSLRISLGRYDPFFGYKLEVTPGVRGATAVQRNNADEQRTLWLKFANTFRLKMAHRVIDMNPTLFDQVLNDCLDPANGGMIGDSDENCYFIYGWEHHDHQDGTAFMRHSSRASLGFVNSLRVLDDPRMHYLLRPNFVDVTFPHSKDFAGNAVVNSHNGTQGYNYTPDFEFMEKHFPDSLAAYGDLLKRGNIYQGISVSHEAWNYDNKVIFAKPNSGKIPTNSAIEFVIKNPNGEAAYISPDSGEEAIPAGTSSITKSIWVAAIPQSRYFNRLGGAQSYYLDLPQPTDNWDIRWQVRLTFPLLTYDEHCFRMALIALKKGGAVGGKDANTWYQEGIRKNMEQLYLDALRARVPITWSEGYPLIRYYKFDKLTGTFEANLTNVNGDGSVDADGNYVVQPYDITSGTIIDDYIASLGTLGSVNDPLEDIGVQAWIAMFQHPEEGWAFYKQTGYPKMVRVEPVSNTSKNPSLPIVPALEKPHSTSGAPMFVPRHGTVPTPNQANIANHDKMRAEFGQAPGYGTTYEDLTGRIFWDQMNPEYVGAN